MPAADAAIPPEVLARFTAAEARLYPMAMTDAAGYQRATALVGVVLSELRKCATTVADVLQQRGALIATLPDLASAAALGRGGLPADAIVDAASAVRCRELQAAATAAAQERRIEAARAAGEEWFFIEPDPDEVMTGTFRRLEIHLLTGSILITSIEAGRDGSGTSYSIEFLGAAEPGMPGSAEKRGYPDRDTWTTAVDAIRAQLARGA
jgi:hypothetical protein